MHLREHLYVGPGKPALVLGRRQAGTAVGGAGVKSQLDVLGVGPALHVDIERSRMHIGQRDERSRKELAQRGLVDQGVSRLEPGRRFDTAQRPVVAGQLETLRDAFPQRSRCARIRTQPLDDGATAANRVPGLRDDMRQTVLYLGGIRGCLQLTRRELSQKLNRLQLSHQSMANARSKPVQHGITDGVRRCLFLTCHYRRGCFFSTVHKTTLRKSETLARKNTRQAFAYAVLYNVRPCVGAGPTTRPRSWRPTWRSRRCGERSAAPAWMCRHRSSRCPLGTRCRFPPS